MTKNWNKGNVSKGFGPSSLSQDAVEDAGRVVVGVKPEDKSDEREIDFAYTVPVDGAEDFILLSGYPSASTCHFLLNSLGDHFRTGAHGDIEEDEWVELQGFLGGTGEVPVRVTQLNPGQRHLAQQNLVCQAPANLPVLWIQVPDPAGRFPRDPGCLNSVMFGDLLLFSRITYTDEDIAEFADHIETPEAFAWWWEQMGLRDQEKTAVVLIGSDPGLSDLYVEYARDNGLIEDEEE